MRTEQYIKGIITACYYNSELMKGDDLTPSDFQIKIDEHSVKVSVGIPSGTEPVYIDNEYAFQETTFIETETTVLHAESDRKLVKEINIMVNYAIEAYL